MNLGDAKKRVLMLLDEYTANGARTVDKDLDVRMNDFFDLAQQEVSRVKPIVKRYTVPLDSETGKPFVEYPMPPDFDRLIRVWADFELTYRGRWLGKSLILPVTEQRQILVEYAAFPTPITEKTPDTLDFELADDAQACLPYHVAASHLFADLVLDNSKFLRKYQEMLALLSPAYEQNGIEIITEAGRPDWF